MRSRLTVLVICMMAMVSLSLRQVPVQASAACPNVVNQGSANSSVFAADCATVAGGENNQATDSHSTVGGGDGNLASNRWSTVGGGEENQASGNSATVGGGGLNQATGSSSTVGGGANNVASGFVATVGGGIYNEASASRATIGGGANNAASALAATVGGGYFNQATASYATIAGGGPADPENVATANQVSDAYGTVGGGGYNRAGNNAGTTSDRPYATVAGGRSNTASGGYAGVLGGNTNSATGSYANVVGGYNNLASGVYAGIFGGFSNSAAGTYSTVLGGRDNQANAAYSIAGGHNARADHLGSFVWSDSLSYAFPSTAIRQFSVRSTGGARFVTAVDGTGAPTAGVELAAGAGAWSTLSDRNVKANITAIDSGAILERVAALPMQEWNYISQDASIRHIGPMAQDFAAAFGVGENTTTISTVDADGVALAAIQGLNQKVEADNAALRQTNAALRSEVDDLQQRLTAVEQAQGSSMPLVSDGLTLSWGMVALGGATLVVLLMVCSISMTLLVLRRRTTSA